MSKKYKGLRKEFVEMIDDSQEKVNHPQHYGGDTIYEVIKVLQAWFTPEEFRGFLKGNVIKYEARARLKAGLEDYKKAQWYQNKLVEFESQRKEGQ